MSVSFQPLLLYSVQWTLRSGLPPLGISVDVPAELALSHHYRSFCPFEKDQCDGYAREKVQDDVMLKFRPELERRATSVLNELHG